MMKTLLPLLFLLALRPAQACDLPSNLDVKEAFPFGFTLIWDAVKGAPGYILYYRQANNPEGVWTQVNTKTNAVTLTGLGANTEYLLRLRTVCKNDSSKMLQARYTTPRVSKYKAPMLYTLQMSEGRIADAGGGLADYGNNEAYAYKILTQTAGKIQLDFSEFSLGANDTLFVYDGSVEGRLIGRYIGNALPKPIVSSEASITLLFVSDSLTNSSGWKGTWKTVPAATPSTLPALAAAAPTKPASPSTGGTSRPTQVPTKPNQSPPSQPTVTPPTSPNGSANLPAPATALAPDADYTGDFTLTFSDTDRAGKGIANRFANIAYTVGGKTRSNPAAGMMWEDFRSISGVWNGRAGVWKTEKGKFLQTDTESKNTNLSTLLTQTDKAGYLYHWRFAMQGKNSSLRAGLHFFCSNPALENRGNSYLVFIRDFEKEADVVELYECVDNMLNLKFKTVVTLNPEGTPQDLKIMYLPSRGKIEVYVNDQFANAWVDDSPLRSGSAISLRSSGCVLESQSLVVYRERSTSMDISIGEDDTDDISLDQKVAVPVQVSTLIVDRNQQWSAVAQAKTRAAGTNEQTPQTPDTQAPNTKPCPDKLVAGKQIRGNYTLEFAPEKGVFERYVLISDYDSEAECWRANQTKGFLVDEFCGSSLEDEWSSVRGAWKEENGELLQTDLTNANTNVAVPLLQQNDGKYLYQFKFNVLDAGENRRVGLHFFADAPEKINRGNSYLVVVRSNDKTPDQLEMYRCENDQINLVTSRPIDVKPNQWADMKLIFSPATGVVNVYLNDAVVLYWKDDKTPFATGKGISLRTGGTRAAFDDVRVYKQYTTKVPVRVGDHMDALLRYETKQTKPAARVYQITRNPEAKILSSVISESTVFFQ